MATEFSRRLAKEQGFASIFCHRPDTEDEGQPKFGDLKDQGQALEVDMYHLPVIPGKITAVDVEEFKRLYESAPKGITEVLPSRGGRTWQGVHA